MALDATVYTPFAVREAKFSQYLCGPYLRGIMEDSVAFDACISYALAMIRLDPENNSRISQVILQHSNRAMSALRRRILLGKDITSDMTIWTVMALCTIHVRTQFNPSRNTLMYYIALHR